MRQDGKASKRSSAEAGAVGSDPAPKKAKPVRMMDSHDLDPSWLGFVADKDPFVPPPVGFGKLVLVLNIDPARVQGNGVDV